jgi:hypothetical protein
MKIGWKWADLFRCGGSNIKYPEVNKSVAGVQKISNTYVLMLSSTHDILDLKFS